MVVPMVVFTWVLSLGACAMGLLPAMGQVAPARILLGTAGVSLVLLGLVLWGLRRSGMLRAGDGPRTLPAYDGTPDAGWKSGGLIYGVGWTLNFARPLAWIYVGGLVVFFGVIVTFAATR
jgi:uncharacterized membrane protein